MNATQNNYHYYNKPRVILLLSKYLLNNIIYIYIILAVSSMYLGIYLVDTDFQQGEYYRIIYIHVTSAWSTILLYLIGALSSILYLLFKSPIFSIIKRQTMKTGFLFSIITLITGSIWGKVTWGTWWAWDARLTSVLILSILYFIYVVITYITLDNSYNNYILSVYILLGLAIIPIIKKSVDWWNTLHQSSSITQVYTHIHISVLTPLILMWASCIIIVIVYYIYSIRLNILQKRLNLYIR